MVCAVDFLSVMLLINLFSDDDFADFQAAPVQAAPVQPVMTASNNAPTTGVKPTLREMLNSKPTQPPVNQTGSLFSQVQPTTYGMNMAGGAGIGGIHRSSQSISSSPQFSSPIIPQTQVQGGVAPMKPASSTPSNRLNAIPNPQTKSTAGSSANFDDLWSMSLGPGSTKPSGVTTNTSAGKSIKDLEREKAMSGLWGGQKPAGGAGAGAGTFGTFGSSTSGGGDDLLL